MSVNVFGYNIVRVSAEREAQIIAARPGLMVEITDHDRARRFKAALPDSWIVYRAYPDDNIWSTMTPAQYHAEFGKWSIDGLFIQVGNEDAPDDLNAYVEWNLELLRLARGAGVRYAVMPFSTGKPKRHETDYAQLLPVFREMENQPGQHLWLPHEYYDMIVRADEWLVGRYRRAWAECDRAGVARPLTAIGEFAVAVGLNPHKGWKDAGSRAVQAEQIKLAAALFYQPDNVPVALFAEQPYAPFTGFDTSREAEINQVVNDRHFIIDLGDGTGGGDNYQPGIVTADPQLRLRAAPSTSASFIAWLPKDAIIDYQPEPVTLTSGHKWVQVRWNGVEGWSSQGEAKAGGLTFIKPYTPPPEPEPPVEPEPDTKTHAFYLTIYDATDEQAQAVKTAFDEYQTAALKLAAALSTVEYETHLEDFTP